ncbi:MFS transporter [Streptomyces sp. DW26H14]|uniref:MFS transporter n=1 Tax=Streptomyces sp. DW26H14 TaxID=3435395 RepID=UPI00403E07B8
MTTATTPLPVPDGPGGARESSKGHGTDNGRPVRQGPLLAVVLGAQFMALLDSFIVNVAAPTIRAEFHASGASLQLVVAGYSIAYAALLITGARLGDRFGHGRAYLAGLAVFTAASLACGLAGSTGALIAFRVVQGAGSAIMIPQVLSLIQRNFAGERRGRALGAYAAVLASGAAAGQVVGGLLVSADLFGTGWRPVFLVNVPIGAVLLAVGARVLPRERHEASERGRGSDLPGLVALAAALVLLTVPLVLGEQRGWPAWCWAMLGGFAVLLCGFLAYETRLAARGGHPLIAPRVLRAPGLGAAAVRILLIMAVNAGFLFTFTLYVQGSLGYSALRAGLTFLPTCLVFGAVGLTWRHWPAAVRRAVVPCGFVLTALACAGLGLALSRDGAGGALMWAALSVLGAGLALGFTPVLTGALAAVRIEDAADASGLLVTTTQTGQLVGVAGLGALYLGLLPHQGAHGGAHSASDALLVTLLVMAGAALLGALAGTARRRV